MNDEPIDVLARRRTDLAVAPADPVRCLFNTMDQPWTTAYEFHYPLEMGVVLSGRMRRAVAGANVVLGPGEVWFCGMWEPHGYEIVERPCHRAVLLIHPPTVAESRFEELPGYDWLLPFTVPPAARPQVAPADRQELLALVLRLRAAARDDSSQRPLRLRLLLLEALLLVMRNWRPPPEQPCPASGRFDRIRPALDLVFASRRRINTVDAARACRLSRNRFSDLFKKITGVTFADFGLRFRLSGAARQIICTDDPLKAVAGDWGFTDESHLCRSFKSHYGVAPAEYRRQAHLTVR